MKREQQDLVLYRTSGMYMCQMLNCVNRNTLKNMYYRLLILSLPSSQHILNVVCNRKVYVCNKASKSLPHLYFTFSSWSIFVCSLANQEKNCNRK